MVESRISAQVREDLQRRGHEVVPIDGWANGKVMGIRYDKERGTILGAVSPKGEIAATRWAGKDHR